MTYFTKPMRKKRWGKGHIALAIVGTSTADTTFVDYKNLYAPLTNTYTQ